MPWTTINRDIEIGIFCFLITAIFLMQKKKPKELTMTKHTKQGAHHRGEKALPS
jgi:hypothetical protein